MTKVAKNSHYLLAWRRIFLQLILLAQVNCHVIDLVHLSYIFSSLFTKVQLAKKQPGDKSYEKLTFSLGMAAYFSSIDFAGSCKLTRHWPGASQLHFFEFIH